MHHRIFLFGEAERGDFCKPVLCRTLPQLAEIFGNPPEETQGIFYAVQTLLHQRELVFFRVKEEGFSKEDYFKGLKILDQRKDLSINLIAIGLPGVGDGEIIQAATPLCSKHKSMLLLSEKDLYDFLTH